MISVIVPIYNAEKFLERSLDNALKSVYRDFELLLVDDGSTDKSGEICERYANQYDNIHVVHHSKNAGLSAARNTGLKHVRGEYVIFMDSDDFVHPQMLQLLHDAITSGDYDFSMALARIVAEDDTDVLMSNFDVSKEPPRLKELSQSDLMAGLWGDSGADFQYQATWNKLFKRKLLDGLTFYDIATEDTEWQTRVFLRTSKAILVEEELYFWVQHQSSLSHAGVSKKYVGCMDTYKMSLDYIPQGSIYRSWCLEKLYKVMARTKYRARNSEFSDLASSIARKIYEETKLEYLDSKISWVKKYGLLLFYKAPCLYGLFAKCAAAIARIKN